jgi:hypothetical protein
VAGTLAAVAVCAGVVLAVSRWEPALVGGERCVAGVGGRAVALDPEQARNAALIAAVAERRDLPARAVTIALATAYQESDLRNVEHGDRDSLGLFQQRPSQGWGSPEQVLDPRYAANRFYDALVTVDGYRELPITVAAQAVQRSAFPDAYADHEADARVLASALTGHSPRALSCTVRPVPATSEAEGEDGLTPRARAVRDALVAGFGDLPIGGFRPGGVDSGHIAGSAHYDGRALDVSVDDREQGWAIAHWTVAHAAELDVATVIFDDHVWTARRSDEGWRRYVHPSGDTENPTLRHLDHVHVDVAR